MIAPEKNLNPTKGILLVIIAFLGFSVMSAFVKVCAKADMTTQGIMFIQNLVALVAILPWVFANRKTSLMPQHVALVLGRSLIGLLSLYFYFWAIKLIPLLDATLLQSTTPIFIPLVALVVFREKISLKLLLIVIAGFTGVAMVLNPGEGPLNSGDFIALFSGLLSAISTILIKLLNDKNESIKVVLFHYLLITTVVMGIWAIPTWVMPSGRVWIYLLLGGLFYAGFQILLIYSVKYASTTTISPFIYLAVVFSGLIDWVVWGEIPHLLTLAGAMVIIASAIASTIHQRQPIQGAPPPADNGAGRPTATHD